mmetsp:Transcript_22898/g.64315  ORF Transcript_22898/g.64315 Transcript_22898/m.64315 type:complete len:234 (-) Transcript_22898:303-1004(-)|eukprot:CAMPEP_0177344914 /NCGR_PEP_ID=MMETSP0368-20130122/28366_1 /TAXON_ID=447022 ORGANISM="Scrippsiella hangoei-like, Strain SHHI-4" /NCGR_SAMPLE_ID=MMETSP0368 /ASSEMBLY_ACC=CAM_ASM_000363 /LENGTH=233 /DNA_ID=CAMNT_0018806451 /DNA_START=50 /DNA_END=751 /DNA_ORIENTATION=+
MADAELRNADASGESQATETKSPLRVLFCHGLESGPTGKKVRHLEVHFAEVRCADMGMSLYSLGKENSLTRSFFPTFWQTSPWQWGAAAAEDSLTRCLEIQRAAIADFNPDVVVGSSWGGGIALLALAEGLWSGPTVAIAPALHRVLRDAGELKYKWAEVEQRLAASAHCLTLVHGVADNTIPIADSETLAAAIHCELVRVDGGDHWLNDALLNGRLRELVVQRHEAYEASTM